MSRVTVVIVTWNSAAVLPECLAALRQQRFRDFSLQVVDNASTDGTPSLVGACYPHARLLKNFSNAGFARANNQGIGLARSEYVLVHNPDVAMRQDALERLVAFADRKPTAASFCPKLLQYPGGEVLPAAVGADDVLDAAGLCMTRSRVGRNRGEGERDRGQFDQTEEVFGAPGACALYRRSALVASAVDGEFFDESFFAYQEDLDLSWRLQLYGFSAWYVPAAVAYHRRAFPRGHGRGHLRLATRQAVPRERRALSCKNHHLMLLKNEQWPNCWRDFLPIAGRELGYLTLSLTLEPFLWRMVPTLVRQLPAAWRQRQVILAHAKVTPEAIRRWFRSGNPKSRI